ncbi:MFS transporter [Propionibacteriaceae bacterium Y1923]
MSTSASPAGNPAATPATGRPWWRSGALMLTAILLLAYNLRPAATEIGPVMPDLQADLGMSAGAAGLLTSLPPICFAVFGLVAPTMATRLGLHRTIVIALAMLVVGSLVRTTVDGGWAFIAWSTFALAGLAMGNVLAPSVIRTHFPERIGLVTALYSLVLSIGVSVASALVVPMANAMGGWRPAFVAMTATAVVALVPWLFALRFDRSRPSATTTRPTTSISLRTVGRTRLGWAIAIFFGMQSGQAYALFGWLPSIYIGAGLSQEASGWLLGLMTALGVPLAFLWPAYMGRNPRPLTLQLVISASAFLGYLGLLVAPATLPWLWAVLLALGTSSFPLILAMFAMLARSGAGTIALSGFGQGVGYALALSGPLLVGVLYDLTHSWTAPLLLFLVLSVVMTIAGVTTITRPTIEDELGLP